MKWFMGAMVIGISLVALSYLKLGDAMVYFYTPAEAQAKAADLYDRQIRVGGLVKPGTTNYKEGNLGVEFTLTDLAGVDLNVDHTGIPPDMFRDGQGVVVEGRVSQDGSSMVSQRLFVKHSEEYRKPESGAPGDMEKLRQSIIKNESLPEGSSY